MTVLELITAAYRKFGATAVGNTLASDMSQDGLEALNLLLEEWENDGTITLTEQQTFNVTADDYDYTIGSGETWDGNKPLRILEAYVTISSIDYPLTEIYEKEYMRIEDKDISAYPKSFCYVPAETTGTVYLYPSPSNSGTITILNNKAFTQYTSLTDDIDLPNGYKSALIWNLSTDMYPEFERKDTPSWLLKRAEDTLSKIKQTNTRRPIPLKYDPLLTGGRARFNMNTGS